MLNVTNLPNRAASRVLAPSVSGAPTPPCLGKQGKARERKKNGERKVGQKGGRGGKREGKRKEGKGRNGKGRGGEGREGRGREGSKAGTYF